MQNHDDRYKPSKPLDPIHRIGKTHEQRQEEFERKPLKVKVAIDVCIWIAAVIYYVFFETETSGLPYRLLVFLVWFGWMFPAYRIWKAVRNEDGDE